MIVDRARIERLVPHDGSMCLLDTVTDWDATHIVCRAPEPGTDHPLARGGNVPAVATSEYAAQATAVHGALLDNASAPRGGMLVKLMNVELHLPCFPVESGPLTVRADLLSRTSGGCLYAFQVGGATQPIAEGRLIVAFVSPGGL